MEGFDATMQPSWRFRCIKANLAEARTRMALTVPFEIFLGVKTHHKLVL